MSEIKGQLLGMVLVLAIFGIIGGVLYAVFDKTANRIGEKVDSAVNAQYVMQDYVI